MGKTFFRKKFSKCGKKGGTLWNRTLLDLTRTKKETFLVQFARRNGSI